MRHLVENFLFDMKKKKIKRKNLKPRVSGQKFVFGNGRRSPPPPN